jgi:hypothetical protein
VSDDLEEENYHDKNRLKPHKTHSTMAGGEYSSYLGEKKFKGKKFEK